MDLNGILEIAIVMAAIYVALSCVVSWLQEQIAAVLRLRGEMLYRGIVALIFGEAGLAKALFTHPLLSSGAGSNKLDARTTARPSYVDPRNFSLAFWQIVHASQGGGQNVPVPDGALPPETRDWKLASTALTIAPTVLADLRQIVGHMRATPRLQQVLTALLLQAGDDYEKLLSATDAWFNAQMDRVSGWYRRQTQYIIIAIALIVVSFSGLDSIDVVTGLSRDQAGLHVLASKIATNPQASIDLVPFTHVTYAVWNTWHDHWAGMLVTLVALSLGGPFWFDALCNLVNVRNAGNKPQSATQS